jgi:hypothetical protein
MEIKYNYLTKKGNSIIKVICSSVHIFLLIIVFQISGCKPKITQQLYENPVSGIKLIVPSNWVLSYSDRSGVIIIEPPKQLFSSISARIEIFGSPCHLETPWVNSALDEININISRISQLYGLETISSIQKPEQREIGEYQITNAIISVPASAMSQDKNRIQASQNNLNSDQIIEIVAKSYLKRKVFMMAYIYYGDDSQLNAQVKEISNSIVRFCSSD